MIVLMIGKLPILQLDGTPPAYLIAADRTHSMSEKLLAHSRSLSSLAFRGGLHKDIDLDVARSDFGHETMVLQRKVRSLTAVVIHGKRA